MDQSRNKNTVFGIYKETHGSAPVLSGAIPVERLKN